MTYSFRHLHFAILFSLLLSCGKGSPTDSGNSSMTYPRSNGIVINGATYDNVVVDFGDKWDAKYTPGSNPPASVTASATIDGDDMSCLIGLPADQTGTFDWLYPSTNSPAPDSYMQITLGGSGGGVFESTSGSTTVTKFSSIGGDVIGYFSGTLRSSDGTKTIDVNGKFVAERF